MILSDKQILEAIDQREIMITPFDKDCLGPNSYDVHLSKHLACYDWQKCSKNGSVRIGVKGSWNDHVILDSKTHNEIKHFEIPEEGFIMMMFKNKF